MAIWGALQVLFVRVGQSQHARSIARGSHGSMPHEGRYPAPDSGIPASPVRKVLGHHKELLARIRVAYGGEEGSFESHLLPVVEGYASLVHLLPATADAHFRGGGGLFRMGLEVAFHALQAADTQIFSARGTVPERRSLEPRWRTATFIAGLCAELYQTLGAVAVIGVTGEKWCPFAMPLAEWLIQGRHQHYFVRWIDAGEHCRAAGILVLPHIVTPTVMTYLSEGNHSVLPQMLATLGGLPTKEHNAIDHIVRRTVGLVVERDLRTKAPDVPDRASPAVPSRLPTGLQCSAADAPDVAVVSSASTDGPVSDVRDRSEEFAESDAGAELDAGGRCPANSIGLPAPEPDVSPAPVQTDSVREPSLPPALNPLVADALKAILAARAKDASAEEGVNVSQEGLFIPLTAWRHRGLETGMVVRALHESGLLVCDGNRKVQRIRVGDGEELGVFLNARMLA
jgi:hypothetical protein